VRHVVHGSCLCHTTTAQGKYCHKYCNPQKVPELEEARLAGKRNMSVCEQQFSVFSRYRFSMNRMNRVRFNFMLVVALCLGQERHAARPVRT
jgi:uncharacterized membrane protein